LNKTLTEQLAQYAGYRRQRNILTHFAGIPMIAVAAAVLLARPSIPLGDFMLSPAVFAAIAALTFYSMPDIRFGTIIWTSLLGWAPLLH
jgi:uncharacterized membrane protein YGL010W